MNEAVIFQSPHAIKPEVFLTEAEREERYRTRLDETFCPYTVLDVLTRVYRHRPEDDLCAAFGKNPGAFASLEEGSSVSRAWVTGCRIVRVETLFFQPLQDFLVELYVQAVMRMEIVRSGQPGVKHTKTVRRDLRLQYRFNLRPCKLTCQFTGVILNEADSLLALNPEAIRADKYLLPILREEDYPYLADMLLSMDGIPKGALLDAEALVKGMGLKLFQGVFPENGVMGEIYFNFGMARIVDPDTGEIREAKIRPGTVLINRSACINRGMYNGTLLHEGSHFLLALKHFLLQMTHGHQYCSYLCKRRGQRRQRERLTPVDIMEIQANKLPGYLMIDEESGRKKAEELIRSYPRLDIKNTAEFVREMAEYFGTTQTLARTRLEAMGYQAVRGILRTANGRIVPAYFSDLKDNQTYIIDHSDALKEYIANREFRAVLDSGQYIYCEGHFCLKQPQYVKIDHVGHPHLTVYAREHMHECCLVFEKVYGHALKLLINGVLRRARGGEKQVRYVTRDGASPITAEGQAFRRMIMQEYNIATQVEVSFNDRIVKLMEVRRISKKQLAERTGLSDATIQSMRNDPDRQFTIESIVAVCIGLHVPVEISLPLIESSPTKFLKSEEMSAYRYVLTHCYEQEVPQVNRFLVEAGYKPLTSLVEGYGEDGVKLEA